MRTEFRLAVWLILAAACPVFAQYPTVERVIPQIGADTTIRILYAGAKDCPPCVAWKGSLGGRGRFLKTEEGKAIEIVSIERLFIRNSFEASDWPEPFRQLWLSAPVGTFNAVPVFGVLIDTDLILTARGDSGWEDKIVPLVKRLYAERKLLQRQSKS